jgi:hypothetical protein
LKEEFDIIPNIAWFIDEFGHSSTNAELLSLMGYDAFYIGRGSNKDKEERRKN